MVSASCSTGQCAGGVVNRGADADISSAPTDVAIHGEIDVAVARILDFLEKRDCAHHLAGLAVPALRDFVGNPSLLYRTGLAPSHRLDRGDFGFVERRNWYRAGAQRPAVHKYRASATLSDPAAELGSGHPQHIAEDPQQSRITVHIDRMSCTIDFDRIGHRLLLSLTPLVVRLPHGGSIPLAPTGSSDRSNSMVNLPVPPAMWMSQPA